jgi:uncharacterized RDD family membrane protein YckC
MTAPSPDQPAGGWQSAAPTPAGPAPGYRYGGFWVRFLALLIDGIALGILTTVISPLFGPSVTTTPTGQMEFNAAANAFSTLLGLVYFIGFWTWRGQTVGMMPFKLQVVRAEDGAKIDWVRGLLRYVGLIISVIPLFVGLIWAAFDSRKQGWHDKIAGTLVIRPT